MKRWNLWIQLKSDFCTAVGENVPGLINTKTALEYGIPYIPAKRIKGCLLEAAREMADNGLIPFDLLERLFGGPGMERGKGLCIGNGHLYSVPESLFGQEKTGQLVVGDYEEFLNAVKCCTDISQEVLENFFTGKRKSTAIETQTGTALKHSLRTIQVVPQGVIFCCEIQGDMEQEEQVEETLALCAKGLRHMGIGITRGLGEVVCKLEEVSQREQRCSYAQINRMEQYKPDEEIVLPYEIELDMPVVMTGGAEGCEDQLPGNTILGALAGLYIRQHSLGANAHEEEDFCRIFLRDGVKFGYGFLNVENMEFTPCPRAIALLKDNTAMWINTMKAENNPRRKSISGQIAFRENKLYLASPEKEIHFHHARPADRGIGHALNDKARDTSVPTGQFFQYMALSKGQKFSGSWIGRAEDIKKLLDCLHKNQYRLTLGRSKSAEYGSCTFRVRDDIQTKHGEMDRKGAEWFLWLVSPLVCRSRENGAYDMSTESFLREMEERLGCTVEEVSSMYSFTTLNGYNSRWRLPLAPCPALAAGSTFHIKTGREIAALEIENLRWGIMTGKGCGQLKAVTWEKITKGEAVTVLAKENSREIVKNELLERICEYWKEQSERQKSAIKVLEQEDKLGQDLPASSDITLLLMLLMNQRNNNEFYHHINKEIDLISESGKKECIKQFINPCAGKSYEFMKQYLEIAKWKARSREGQNDQADRKL